MPLGIIGTAKRTSKSTAHDSPGPGAYSQRNSWKTNGWTILGKQDRPTSSDGAPGPGTYFPKIKGGTPAYSIGHKQKKKIKVDGPGPTAYFPSIYPVKPRPKSATFTSGRKDRPYGDATPGPGNYYPKSMNKGPSTSIKGRPKTAYKSEGPGPGAYSYTTAATKPRPASAKFGSAARGKTRLDNTPGPGQYKWDPKYNKGVKIGKASRDKPSRGRDGPGPGQYKLKSTIGNKPGKTMAGKRKEKSVDD